MRHTSDMEYHEAFWVVIGTAAPVVALSLTVSATRGIRASKRHGRGALWLYTLSIVGYCAVAAIMFNALDSLRTKSDAEMGTAEIVMLFAFVDMFAITILAGFTAEKNEADAVD
jgi:hypothetical protein